MSIRSVSPARLIAILILGLAALVQPRTAFCDDDSVRIAAVVNDDAITVSDVDTRMKLVLAAGHIEDTPETRRRLEPDVLRSLINEKLELQEARRLKIRIDPREVDAQYAAIEQQNGMPPGGLEKALAQVGVSKDTLIDQITARIAWGQVVRRRWAPFVTVGDDEIEATMKDLKAHAREPENRVAQIFLPVANPADDGQVKDAADHLVEEIHDGARFPELARQFSQGPEAASGGDLGWMKVGSLSPEKEEIIAKLQPGGLAGPVRLTGGYYIFTLIDRRSGGGTDDIQVALDQVVFPLAADADAAARDAAIAKAKSTTEAARSCSEFEAIGHNVSPDLSGPLGKIRIGELPPELRPKVANAKVAVPLDPVQVRGGIGVFMVCARSEGVEGIDRNAVYAAKLNERLGARAEQYLNDLRRTAYIDIRA